MRRAAMKLDIIIVAAVAENGVIGRGNALPWRLKSDMAHFRELTMGKPVVLGRKTYQSIGKPLVGRTTIVVSRDGSFNGPGIIVAPSLALPLATRLFITEVHNGIEGDARFPQIDPKVWRESARSEHEPGPQDDAAFALVTYDRG